MGSKRWMIASRQHPSAFVVVADDRWRLRPRKVDVDVADAGGFAEAVDAVGIRCAGDEQFVDRIGDQRFDRRSSSCGSRQALTTIGHLPRLRTCASKVCAMDEK